MKPSLNWQWRTDCSHFRDHPRGLVAPNMVVSSCPLAADWPFLCCSAQQLTRVWPGLTSALITATKEATIKRAN